MVTKDTENSCSRELDTILVLVQPWYSSLKTKYSASNYQGKRTTVGPSINGNQFFFAAQLFFCSPVLYIIEHYWEDHAISVSNTILNVRQNFN